MDLSEFVTPKRANPTIDATTEEWRQAKGVLDYIQLQLLPSEESVYRTMTDKAQRELAWHRAERHSIGRIDLAALLTQQRTGPAPRWFVYDPMIATDKLVWVNLLSVSIDAMRLERRMNRLTMGFPNSFPRTATYSTRPIMLPARVRDKVVSLHHEGITSYVLFEPRLVESCAIPVPKPIRRPDPALVIEAAGAWFSVEHWEQPDIEDPRAINSLKEFFVSHRVPPWLNEK